MTAEEIEKEIKDLQEWFEEVAPSHPELTGEKEKDKQIILGNIAELNEAESGEAHIDFHLNNGDVIKTRSRSVDNYCAKSRWFVGDYIEFSDGWLYVENKSEDGIRHNLRINPESIAWIDTYETEINWHSYLGFILSKLGLR